MQTLDLTLSKLLVGFDLEISDKICTQNKIQLKPTQCLSFEALIETTGSQICSSSTLSAIQSVNRYTNRSKAVYSLL
jgi:hypothetical protein